jgi:hypothetical protein
VIALAAIDLAAEMGHMVLTKPGSRAWFERLTPPAPTDAIEFIKRQILELYGQSGHIATAAARRLGTSLTLGAATSPPHASTTTNATSNATTMTTTATTAAATSPSDGSGGASRKRSAVDDDGDATTRAKQPSPARVKIEKRSPSTQPPPPPLLARQPPPPPIAVVNVDAAPTDGTSVSSAPGSTTTAHSNGVLAPPPPTADLAAPASPRADAEHNRPALQSPTSGMSPAGGALSAAPPPVMPTSSSTMTAATSTPSVAHGVALAGVLRPMKTSTELPSYIADLDDDQQRQGEIGAVTLSGSL